MGREAAVDELLGKLSSSCALYARARLLLLQLACEPEVGEADRAVLLKYIAGFEWRALSRALLPQEYEFLLQVRGQGLGLGLAATRVRVPAAG